MRRAHPAVVADDRRQLDRKAAKESVTVKDLSAKAATSTKAGMAAVRRRLAWLLAAIRSRLP